MSRQTAQHICNHCRLPLHGAHAALVLSVLLLPLCALQETVLSLLRNPEYCVYADANSEVVRGPEEAEQRFSSFSLQVRDGPGLEEPGCQAQGCPPVGCGCGCGCVAAAASSCHVASCCMAWCYAVRPSCASIPCK